MQSGPIAKDELAGAFLKVLEKASTELYKSELKPQLVVENDRKSYKPVYEQSQKNQALANNYSKNRHQKPQHFAYSNTPANRKSR
ncbi:MAG: hypothetical protein JSS07_11380 [Proteobacteria bacterium]|nr:hypothetical protein [Pseudomonadota bacterium]